MQEMTDVRIENGAIKNYPEHLLYQIKSFERIPIELFESARDGSIHIANSIALALRSKQQRGKNLVVGLATGSSPIRVYAELIRMHKEEGLSFKNMIAFNLDEYYPIAPEHPESYHNFMAEYLFDHIDIDPNNIHIPTGTLPLEEIEEYCKMYEKQIELAGGLDIQLLGIGRTGHIGFNEPGSEESSQTRLVRLDNITRRDAQKDFDGIESVPYRAITMGVGTIMKAREIYIMAWGQHKADIVQHAIELKPTAGVPATYLQNHDRVTFYLDKESASKLTRVQTPWKTGSCRWDDELTCKAVTWLSKECGKPILKLTDEDYAEYGLSELILNRNSAYQINIEIFNRLQHTITGWPGGKPDTDDTFRPERSKPKKKRVLIFSPHPDDDVISMGGTFIRLVEQGHDVHVAYQTSGNIAVHDHDAQRYLDFFEQYLKSMDSQNTFEDALKAKQLLESKSKHKNSKEVRKIKGLVRRGEARLAARFCGLKDNQIHHLDMPFYETGKVKKKSLSDADIEIIMNLLESFQPHQVFAAGDLSDPHGTHRICLDAVIEAFRRLKHKSWVNDCWLWLYRGAWHEFAIDEIEMTVPLSPAELLKKRKAIYAHQSQKDKPPFPGEDHREFWQRSEDRNKATATMYRDLGFAAYEAMEAFRRWHF